MGQDMTKVDEEYRGFTIKYSPAMLMVEATAYSGANWRIGRLTVYGYGREDACRKIQRQIDAYLKGNEQ
jgi:hypothetical protein